MRGFGKGGSGSLSCSLLGVFSVFEERGGFRCD